MKILVTFLLVLLLLVGMVGGLPNLFGAEAEKIYHKVARRLKDTGQVKAIDVQFKRGWFNSVARTRVRFHGIETAIVVEDTIAHGPYPVTRLLAGDLDFKPVLGRVTTTIRRHGERGFPLPPIQAETVFETDGGGHSRITAPPYRNTNVHGTELDTSGFAGSIRFRPGFGRIIGSFGLPRLQLNLTGGTISVTGLESTFDVYDGFSGFSLGEITLGAQDLAFATRGGDPIIAGHEVGFESVVRENAEEVNATWTLQIEKMALGGAEFGPGEVALHVRKLDGAILTALRNQLVARGHAQKKSGEPLVSVPDALARLSRRSPELRVDKFRFATEQGEVTGKLRLVLNPDDSPAGKQATSLLHAVDAEGRLALPQAMIKTIVAAQIKLELASMQLSGEISPLSEEQIQAIADKAVASRIDKWAEENRFVREGWQYVTELRIEDGTLFINNQPANLAGSSAIGTLRDSETTPLPK